VVARGQRPANAPPAAPEPAQKKKKKTPSPLFCPAAPEKPNRERPPPGISNYQVQQNRKVNAVRYCREGLTTCRRSAPSLEAGRRLSVPEGEIGLRPGSAGFATGPKGRGRRRSIVSYGDGVNAACSGRGHGARALVPRTC